MAIWHVALRANYFTLRGCVSMPPSRVGRRTGGSRLRANSSFQRRIVVVLAGVLALAVMPALAGRRSATVSAAVGGPDVGSQQPSIAWESPAQMNADLDAMVAAGMTWVRADFYWSTIEQQRGRFAWSATDTFVRAATARGLRVLAMADYTPSWARSGPTDKYPPNDPATTRRSSQAAAHSATRRWACTHGRSGTSRTTRCSGRRADPAAYTAMLKLAGAAIKRADPSATVVTGGLSPASDNGRDVAPLTFLASIYAHGGGGSFDAVGYHPYSYPYAPMYAGRLEHLLPDARRARVDGRNGDGAKQIWGTEVGFPTGTGSKAVSEATQADDITAAIDQWTSWSFHGPIFFYTIRDLGTNRSDVNDNMGMVDHAGAPKPVFAAVRRQLQAPQDVRATPAGRRGRGDLVAAVVGLRTPDHGLPGDRQLERRDRDRARRRPDGRLRARRRHDGALLGRADARKRGGCRLGGVERGDALGSEHRARGRQARQAPNGHRDDAHPGDARSAEPGQRVGAVHDQVVPAEPSTPVAVSTT